MPTTRIGVIINPRSGRRGRHVGEGQRRRSFVEQACLAASIAADIRMTSAPEEATILARQFAAADCGLVIAMGGDGTVNEVGAGLLGTNTALGIIPCGSGDGLARGLGIPSVWSSALGRAVAGRTARIDVGYVGARLFLNVAGVGFDAEVAHAFASGGARGFAGYTRDITRLAREYRPDVTQLLLDGRDYSGRWFLAAFANGAQYGNGAVLAPDADPSDGVLDVVLIEAGSPAGHVWRSRRFFWRRRAPAAGVHRLRVTTATVHAERLRVHVDGEPVESRGPLDIRVAPAALLVRI